MSKKQTAVEWLVTQQREINLRLEADLITSHEANSLERNAVAEALEMEREQIKEAAKSTLVVHSPGLDYDTLREAIDKHGIDYYNKTYGKEERK